MDHVTTGHPVEGEGAMPDYHLRSDVATKRPPPFSRSKHLGPSADVYVKFVLKFNLTIGISENTLKVRFCCVRYFYAGTTRQL